MTGDARREGMQAPLTGDSQELSLALAEDHLCPAPILLELQAPKPQELENPIWQALNRLWRQLEVNKGLNHLPPQSTPGHLLRGRW